MANTYFNLASGSFTQNWTDTGLITTDDDWSAVPSIVGYRGDDLTGATGTDPQTILSDGTTTPVDVQANQTNPNLATAAGGVAEFHLADPTIALNGSGTADAPFIVLHMNSVGRANVTLSFDARDLDSSADNAIQRIAVQYRIGETGNWTNIPEGFIADATEANLATLVTPVSITLPQEADNQAQLQIRIITANAVGNDEWVGIDDIVVDSIPAQSVQFADDSLTVATSEGDAGTTAFTFTVERTGDTEGDINFTIELAATAADSADFIGGPALPLTINGTIPAGQSSATVTVNVSGDTTIEDNESFTLTITEVTNSASATTVIGATRDTATGRILTDDFSGTDVGGIAILPQAESLQGSEDTPEATNAIQLVRLGTFAATDGNAEVVSFDPVTDQLYILNATGGTIEIVKISSSGALSKTGEIDLSTLTEFGGANSVAVKNGIVAVAYGNATLGDNGYVALFNATGSLQGAPIEVGVLPDMLTFTPDGSRILVANEAEAIDITVNPIINPNGTISIIDVSGGAASATVQTTVGFTALNGHETDLDGSLGFSMFPGQSASADFEPEYISVSPDGTRAYVTLQEVNGVAVIDLTNPAATAPLAILPLGSIDRSLAGNEFDGSDQDGPGSAGKINIQNWPVASLLQPDAIATFEINGETYFVTANEGDARVGTGLTTEEVRLSSGGYDLDNTTAFTPEEEDALKNNDNIGRLNVINHEGDTNGDGDIDVITTYGGRGISIFKVNADGSIEKVRETGGEFEQILSQQPNANILFNGENTLGSFDTRSDNKGPEPEGVDIGVIGGRTYAFVTLERAGGVMIYDVTDPANASFVGYKPPLPPALNQPSPDNAPETVKFISATDSPTGTPLVVTANEVGNATAVYAVVTPIYQIQGTGHTSAYDGQAVSTTGVVTAVDSNGFYIQAAQGDGNAATSDAIFVFTNSAPTVVVGLEVMVTGTVDEFVPNSAAQGSLPITEIVAPNSSVITLGIGAAIAPVEIGGAGNLAPPTQDIVAGAAFWEALEGMLVKINDAVAVGPSNNFGEVYTVVDNDDDPSNGLNATGLTERGTLQFTPGTPEADDPATTGTDSLTTTNTTGGDFNPERIQIDDDSGVLPGFATPAVGPGAVLSDVVGVVSYNFGNYEVIPTQPYTVVQASTLVKETTTLAGTEDRLTVASYNAENLDPGDGVARFNTLAAEILNNLGAPDIIALQEVQDNNGTTVSSTTAANVTLQMLVDALNAAAPDGVEYAFIDNPFIGSETNGGAPGGNIRNAFLYRTDRVDLVEGSLATLAADGSLITDPAGNTDQQTNPDNPFFESRPPLVATFTFNDHDVTIVNNHFTSKGGSGALFGSDQPPLNAGEPSRAAQAQAVNNFVDSLLGTDPDAKVIVAGDLNEFPSEEPMAVLRGEATISNYDVPASDPFFATATYTPGGLAVLNDLLETLPAGEQYDYFFEGNVQTLDHVLVTEGLIEGAQFDVVRINAEFANQTSDHDPLVASFLLEGPEPPPYKLQILHASDFEAGLDAVDRAGNFAAIVDYLEETYENSITLSSGDNYLPSPFFNAGSDASLKEVYETALESHYNLAPGTLNIAPGFGTADISMLNIIGIEASAIGNHEFDAGTNPFAAIIRQTERVVDADGPGGEPGVVTPSYPGAQFPYLSANINFSGDSNLNPLFTNLIQDAENYTGFPPLAGIGKKIAPATIINENGERIGVVGATTQIVESISSTGGIDIIGDDVNDMAALASILQPTIDALLAQGINKIILVSHLQQIEFEQELAPLLHGVDIIISGGSNTLLADDQDVLRPGDAPQGPYPIVTENADGNTTLIVNTDGEYSYVGRLVVDFDADGDIIASSVDPDVSGAFATTDEVVDALYAQGGVDVDHDGDVDANDANPFANGSRGDLVNDIAQAVGNLIDQQDGNIFGKTDVYLEGRRTEVRAQETNLGDLTADANLWYAQQTDDEVIVSIKNGGGIRDSIGRIEAVGDDAVKLPPAANPEVGKEEGDVSQLDIANAVRFNNALSLVTLTPQQLLEVLENGVSNPGGIFAQIGGVKFSYNTSLAVGNRVESVALINEAGETTAVIVEDGDVVVDAPSAIRVVTLSFLIGAPDSNGVFARPDGFRFAEYIAANPTFADRVDLDPTAGQTDGTKTGVAQFTDDGREQDALAEYMAEFYADTPFAQADTPQAQDTRIQNLGFRTDTVLDNEAPTIAGDLGITVNEGQTVVITTDDLDEADPDHSGALLTYTVTGTVNGDVLVSGVAATSFTQADLAAGLVSFSHDGPNSSDASFTVTLTDALGLTSDESMVTVTVNNPAVFSSPAEFSVAENETSVGTVTATDPEDDLFTFAIAGGDDAEFFAINPNTGALSFLNSPDFETSEDADGDNVYDVVVSATDALGASNTQAINVSVTDVAESGGTFRGGSGDQAFVGTTGADTMDGGNGNDDLTGNDGNDTIKGGNGDDNLAGGRGDDNLLGGGDNDVLNGGAGDDIMGGGTGDDQFVFEPGFGNDVITDLRNGDQIVIDESLFEDLPALLAASEQVGRDVVITLDVDNTITLQGVRLNSLDANDFLFA